MNRKTVFATLLAIGTCAAASTSAAQTYTSADDKIVSGAACVPGLTTSYNDVDIRATFIKNTSTGYRWVACTIPVDSEQTWKTADTASTLNNGYAAVRIQLKYGGTLAQTKCVVQVAANGSVLESVTIFSPAPGDLARGAFYGLASPKLYEGNGNNRPVGVNCLLAPGVKLVAINLEEYAHTAPEVLY